MAKSGFRGLTELALDAKGRLAVPVRYRDLLAERSQGKPLIVTKHWLSSLLIFFSEADYDDFLEQLEKSTVNSLDLQRLLVGGACDIEVDSASRLLIPSELRSYAKIEKDVCLVGMRSRFELWDARTYAEYEASKRPELANALATVVF